MRRRLTRQEVFADTGSIMYCGLTQAFVHFWLFDCHITLHWINVAQHIHDVHLLTVTIGIVDVVKSDVVFCGESDYSALERALGKTFGDRSADEHLLWGID